MAFTAEHSERSHKDFPALSHSVAGRPPVFLDGPGGSQVPRVVIETMSAFYDTCNVNAHGNFPPSREVDRRMEVARATLATFLGAAGPQCISFGQNMTTLNFALSTAIGPHLAARRRGAHHATRSRSQSRAMAQPAGPRRRAARGRSQALG